MEAIKAAKKRGPKQFRAFRPAYKDTVSANVLSAARDIEQAGLNPKPLIVYYFLGGNAKEIERGVVFSQSLAGAKRTVAINGKRVPLFDPFEQSLCNILFGHDTLWEVGFRMPSRDGGKYLEIYGKRWMSKYVQINSAWGLTAMRNLRLWACTHDYHLPLSVVLPY